MNRGVRWTVLLLAVALLLPSTALAESHEEAELKPITWISFLKAQPGMGDDLVMALQKDDAAVYDSLLAEGHALSWGVGQQINHFEGDSWSHVQWVTLKNWAAADVFLAKFFAARGAMSAEDGAAQQEKWLSMVVPGSHFDAIVRHQVFEVNPEAGPPRYISLGFHKAQPGQEAALKSIWDDFAKPVFAQVLADGTVSSYGLYVPELHGDPRWSHVSWYATASLAATEAVTQAFYGAMKAGGPERQKEFADRAAAATVPDAHQDRILIVTHSAAAQQPE